MTPPVLEILEHGELELCGQVTSASNVTLVAEAELAGHRLRCVYKPVRGEAPLWDFPNGTLAGREVAAYLISDALGWELIPPTGWRQHGPTGADLGPGMVQLWIDTDNAQPDPIDVVVEDEVPAGWHVIAGGYGADGTDVVLVHDDSPRLHRLAVLDVVLNNADRKGGHVLTDANGISFGIDHGICLHEENKLRTVLWGWSGAPVDPELIGPLQLLARRLDDPTDPLTLRLGELITPTEIAASARRARELATTATMPFPPQSRPIPWPPF